MRSLDASTQHEAISRCSANCVAEGLEWWPWQPYRSAAVAPANSGLTDAFAVYCCARFRGAAADVGD